MKEKKGQDQETCMQVHLLVILFTGSTDDPSIHPSILHKKKQWQLETNMYKKSTSSIIVIKPSPSMALSSPVITNIFKTSPGKTAGISVSSNIGIRKNGLNTQILMTRDDGLFFFVHCYKNAKTSTASCCL